MSNEKVDPDWAEAIRGVKPIGEDGRVQKDPPKVARRPRSVLEEPPGFDFDPVAIRPQSPFDPLLFEKISEGKVKIQFSFDLHGYTEREAFDTLLDILGHHFMAGRRYGLIVTGKGREGKSPIRAQLPKWLSSPKLSQVVSSYIYAAQRHGGDGAFYVLLRRQDR